MLAAVAVVTGAVVARKMGLLMLFSVSFNKLFEGGGGGGGGGGCYIRTI